MKLMEYGDWTLFVPFFTTEKVTLYRGFRNIPASQGTLYFIANTLIVEMKQCNIQGYEWLDYQVSKTDQADLFNILRKEDPHYAS